MSAQVELSTQQEVVIKALELCNSTLLEQHRALAVISECRALTPDEHELMSDIERSITCNSVLIKKNATKILRSLLRAV